MLSAMPTDHITLFGIYVFMLVTNLTIYLLTLTVSHLRRSDFADDSFRMFKYLVVTVMQPFRLGYPFGIESLVVTKPCYADKIQKQAPGLSDPNKCVQSP